MRIAERRDQCNGSLPTEGGGGAEQLASFLTSLYNSCIAQGRWPIDWKKGGWAPVHQKAGKGVIENYSPIAVLNAVDKVFEKELCKQAAIHLKANLALA